MQWGWIVNLLLIAVLCFTFGFIFEVFFLVQHGPSHLDKKSSSSLTSLRSRQRLERGKAQHASIPDLMVSSPTASTESSREAAEPVPCSVREVPVVAHNTTLHLQEVLTNIPPIVSAWRNARLDWHQLLPLHNSKWERFGTPQKEGKLRLLVSKEEQVTDYLTRFEESGLSSVYGHEHGPLTAYRGCDAFQSPCMIHHQTACLHNQLCQWSEQLSLCVDVLSLNSSSLSNGPSPCSSPQAFVADHGLSAVSDISQCHRYVDQPVILLRVDSEAQTMFYHWWAAWQTIHKAWHSQLDSSRTVHFFVDSMTDSMFFQYFGLLSNYCWRRGKPSLPIVTSAYQGLCFCNVRKMAASQGRVDAVGSASQLVSFLGLSHVRPPAHRAKIGIISRRRKRFILNEYELVAKAMEMGYDCELLPLEKMTLFEQMRSLRSLDVLIGIHGSALDNSVFLHPESVLVQLLPYSVEHRVTFESSAKEAKIIYQEWQLKDSNKAVFHWDLLQQADSEKLQRMTKEEILLQGQRGADNRETTMFWINQDIIVPLEEWAEIVETAVKASPAMKRVPVD